MEIFLASLITWSHCQADTVLVVTSEEVWGKWWMGVQGALGGGKSSGGRTEVVPGALWPGPRPLYKQTVNQSEQRSETAVTR